MDNCFSDYLQEKKDKNGESLNEPVKMFDHLLDAVRGVVQS